MKMLLLTLLIGFNFIIPILSASDVEDLNQQHPYVHFFAASSSSVDASAKKNEDVPDFVIAIDTNDQISYTDREYLSITIDSGEIQLNWKNFDFNSKKLQQLAAALSPCNLRLGGTTQDLLTFDPSGRSDQKLPKVVEKEGFTGSFVNFTMTGKQWTLMADFAKKVGWGVIFGLNLMKRKDGFWDPTNAQEFLKYSATIGARMPAFQLGNEPDLYKYEFNTSLSGETMVEDFKTLRTLLWNTPTYAKSKLYGPDVCNLGSSLATNALKAFLKAGAYKAVDEIDLHHYYLNGHSTKPEQMIDPQILDSLHGELKAAVEITQSYPPTLKFRLSETSSCYDMGAPNISDKYVAGFMWLDKLGMSATYGATAVFRQTFFGLNYALISDSLDPNPDYFLSVLYKRLVEGPVFRAATAPSDNHLRVYSHCARRDFYQYPPGAVVVYYMNLLHNGTRLTLPQFKDMNFELFQLTSGDDGNLLSGYVKLNGKRLVMSGDSLPSMNPVTHQGELFVPALSMGFLVVPDAEVSLCM